MPFSLVVRWRRFYSHFRALGFREVVRNGFVYFLTVPHIGKMIFHAKPIIEVEIPPGQSRLFLHLAKRRLKIFLAFVEFSFRKIPIRSAMVEEEEFRPLLRAPVDDHSRGYLALFFIHILRNTNAPPSNASEYLCPLTNSRLNIFSAKGPRTCSETA